MVLFGGSILQVEVDGLSEDFSVEDGVEEADDVPWIHFEQDVVNLHEPSLGARVRNPEIYVSEEKESDVSLQQN